MVNAQLPAVPAQPPRMSAQNRSSSATDGLEKTSPDGSRRTMGSRVQERRQSRVEQLMRPLSEASGNASTRAERNSSSNARPRPSASQRGPTQTRTRQGVENEETPSSDINGGTPQSSCLLSLCVSGMCTKRQDASNLAKFGFFIPYYSLRQRRVWRRAFNLGCSSGNMLETAF